MSVAIQWGYPTPSEGGTQGFIYMDATTSLDKTLTGQVSKNPIDGGGNIADHFTRDNPIVTFSGVISGVDISAKYKQLKDDGNGNRPTNVKNAPDAVKINNIGNEFYNLVPDAIGQFFKPSSPSIVLSVQSSNTLKSIQQKLESLFLDGNVQLITLYEYQGNELRREPLTNLVMTSLRFSDGVDTGNALYCSITLEQVTFADSKKVTIPKELVSPLIESAASPTEDLGKQDSTKEEVVTNAEDESILFFHDGSVVKGVITILEGM